MFRRFIHVSAFDFFEVVEGGSHLGTVAPCEAANSVARLADALGFSGLPLLLHARTIEEIHEEAEEEYEDDKSGEDREGDDAAWVHNLSHRAAGSDSVTHAVVIAAEASVARDSGKVSSVYY